MTRLEAHQQRLKHIQTHIPHDEVWLFGTPPLIQYLSGFEFLVPNEREAFLVVTSQQAYVLCGGFTMKNVLNFMRELGIKPLQSPHKVLEHVSSIMRETGAKKLVVDVEGISARELLELGSLLPQSHLLHIPSVPTGLLKESRLIKDEYEQTCLQKAGALIKKVMESVISQLHTGIREVEVKSLLDYELLKAGSKPSFPTIVAFGANAVEPHYQPAEALLKPGMPVLLDAGAMIDGYCSDMTRTVWFKGNTDGDAIVEPSEAFLHVERVVKEGYDAAITGLRKKLQGNTNSAKTANITASNLDALARDCIQNQNLGQFFIHTLGHGVGLEIHEAPSIGSADLTPLAPGMAITIEPGLYLPPQTIPHQPQAIGYRFENTCLITPADVLELT